MKLDIWKLHLFTPKYYLGYLTDGGLVERVGPLYDTFEEAEQALRAIDSTY